MLVYRDGSRETHPAELRDELFRNLRDAVSCPGNSTDRLLTPLLRAGELECALADGSAASSPPAFSDAVHAVSLLTDALADALLSRTDAVDPNLRRWLRMGHAGETDPTLRAESALRMGHTARSLSDVELPAKARVSAPEGFAYYALDPLAYADVAGGAMASDRPLFVIGLRTIGTTLSAVVAAAARRRGARVERITVRPAGHPFDRKTEFSAEQRRLIAAAAARRSQFVIVDEGPGLSGSSLLSVADALMALGIAIFQIVVCCAHQPNLAALCAPRAAERWSRLRVVAAGTTAQPPADAAVDWSGGRWRAHLYDDATQWPAAWPQVERLKLVSRDGARLYKFEGLGPYGEAPLERSRLAAEAGWSPEVEIAGNGFAAYARVEGRPMSHRDLDARMINALARYCDFRQREMCPHPSGREGGPQDGAQADGAQAHLGEMLRVNVQEEFGFEYDPGTAEMARPVIADARLMPHEWLRDPDERIWKTDAVSHGDDHFYPGATDIAWDLAGAIVEWRMHDAAAEAFLEGYRRLSSDDARGRLPFFMRAYSAFRLGFCRMAAQACCEERKRLTSVAEYYRRMMQLVASRKLSQSVCQSVSRSRLRVG